MPDPAPTLHACPHCGARVSIPAGQLSEKCAFCDTPLVAWDGAREPVDLVAPFVLDRAQAAARLKQHLGARMWAPEAVRRLDPQDLHGVLVPFYCFDATAHSTYSARVGIWWYRTETYTVIVNGKVQTRTRTVRETEWFSVHGSHVASYQDHLVSGSHGLPEAESNELEPFDLGLARPFDPALIAGWAAELPDVGHEEAHRTAAAELRGVENRAIASFLPGNENADVHNDTRLEVGQLRLVLLPVWTAAYQHKNKPMRLLVNGQTGEVVGKVPRSWVKITLAVLLALALIGGAVLCGGLIAAIAGQLS
ncbi:MAG: hypothetical protein ABIO70_34400 [Pseudomonadota bacterium]